jgi:putative transposase
MSAIKSWTVSNELWERVKPLIPKQKPNKTRRYLRRPGGGRKPMEPRKVFEGIIFVLRTGCQWKALPKKEFGSASSIHKYFLEWKRRGYFPAFGERAWRNTTKWKEPHGRGKASMVRQ